jgi:hypothetical protein
MTVLVEHDQRAAPNHGGVWGAPGQLSLGPKGSNSLLQAEPNIPPQLAAYIGEQLRAHYAALLREPIPDRFVAILRDLDQASQHEPQI